MSEHIKNYQDWRQYPSLVYFVQKNPKYGKTYTLGDIEYPDEELYQLVLSDWATLGRPAIPYEEWAAKYREMRLNDAINSAKCSVRIVKHPVSSFDDISKIKEMDGFVRYIEKGLNEHFGVNE